MKRGDGLTVLTVGMVTAKPLLNILWGQFVAVPQYCKGPASGFLIKGLSSVHSSDSCDREEVAG